MVDRKENAKLKQQLHDTECRLEQHRACGHQAGGTKGGSTKVDLKLEKLEVFTLDACVCVCVCFP